MDPIVRGWIAVTDRAIDDARDSLATRDVAALRLALSGALMRAFDVLATFESGSRSERIAAAGRLFDMFGDDVDDLGLVEAHLVRAAVQDCCDQLRINEKTARRLAALAHGYSLQLTCELQRVAGNLDPDYQPI